MGGLAEGSCEALPAMVNLDFCAKGTWMFVDVSSPLRGMELTETLTLASAMSSSTASMKPSELGLIPSCSLMQESMKAKPSQRARLGQQNHVDLPRGQVDAVAPLEDVEVGAL